MDDMKQFAFSLNLLRDDLYEYVEMVKKDTNVELMTAVIDSMEVVTAYENPAKSKEIG